MFGRFTCRRSRPTQIKAEIITISAMMTMAGFACLCGTIIQFGCGGTGSGVARCQLRISPMAAHILQVAYYPNLQETRALMLKSADYEVTSVLGNDEARRLDAAVIATADLIVVGFSAPHSVRANLL
jgi:hypothetical protein